MTDHRAPEGKALVATFVLLAGLACGEAMADPTESMRIGDGIAAFALGEHARAREIFERLAAAGDGEASWRLGWMAESGHGGPVDLEGALALYARAAKAGHGAAAARLAMMAAEGVFPDSDPDVLELLREAAGGGSIRAMLLLGKAHAEGEIAPLDHAAAAAWFGRVLEADPEGRYAPYARDAILLLERASGALN